MKFPTLLLLAILCSVISWGQVGKTPYVVLVSFDGFRYDYAEKYNAPNFKKFMREGAKAEALIPSFPSKTFPNHYSIVTGLYPGNHGLVDNSFYDADRKEYYEMHTRERVTDPFYYSGIPLWKLARQHGIKSASMFWIGSELTIPELRPDYHFDYDESVSDSVRIQQVLSWLKLPESERPHFITLYFSYPDHEGHLYGPLSEQTKQAVLRADRNLGILINGLRQTNLPINLLVVSDHGMEELKTIPESYIFLREILNRDDTTVRVSNAGTQAHLYVSTKSKIDSLYQVLKKREENFSVLRQNDFPKHWHYKTPRAGDLLITAGAGFYLVDQPRETFLANLPPGKSRGIHGYDEAVVKNMRGIFYAMGPQIKKGMVIPAFENVHVYPLVANILGLPLPDIDGHMEVLQSILSDQK